ncbi:ATP-binding protein [Planctomycetota bacterium]
MGTATYPFSAIVGQDAMKMALLLNAIDPTIGGVLIRGQKGTGKSTAVRALGSLLPRGRLVELPLNATEDRLVGTLHLEEALRTGERRFQPGLLAEADRGLLYVDEVNLLDDHLVDLLLDVAASGVNRVEREGISESHDARFVLVGTMNPEEGELRPQLLDRFGLCVVVTGLCDPAARQRIVHQQLLRQDDPESFAASSLREDEALAQHLAVARSALVAVQVPGATVAFAVSLSMAVEAPGHRAEIALVKAARALAALREEPSVGEDHVVEVAGMALRHRMARSPLEGFEDAGKRVTAAVARVRAHDDGTAVVPLIRRVEDLAEVSEFMDVRGAAAGSTLSSQVKKKLKTS